MLRSTPSSLTKQTMGRGATAHLLETAFDDVSSAQFAPQVRRQLKEAEQVGQILLEFVRQSGEAFLPAGLEAPKAGTGGAIAGQLDGLSAVFHGGEIAAAHSFEQVAHLAQPATLIWWHS